MPVCAEAVKWGAVAWLQHCMQPIATARLSLRGQLPKQYWQQIIKQVELQQQQLEQTSCLRRYCNIVLQV